MTIMRGIPERAAWSGRAGIGAAFLLTMLASACAYYPSFGFPVEEGDVDAGRQAFIDLQCHRCHSVAGVGLPAMAGAASAPLELGGATSRVKAYSDLVTSIINPDHRIAESYREQQRQSGPRPQIGAMPTTHIDTMTIRQLIDVVAFLDSRYELIDDYRYDFADDLEQVSTAP